MKRLLFWLFAGLLPTSAWPAPYISEFSSDYQTRIADKDGDYPDWIEIHNPEDTLFSLTGWHLTDNPDNLQKWAFPTQAKVPAGGYLVVFASGKNRGGLFDTEYHTIFRINDNSEYLALVNADGEVVSEYQDYPRQVAQASYGETNGVRGFFDRPTPGTPNDVPLDPPAGKVEFSQAGGTFAGSITVELTCPAEGARIRFTTDNSEPVESLFKTSDLYEGPIEVTRTMRLRARGFLTGSPPGDISSASYLKIGADIQGFSSNLPLIFLDSFGRNIDGETRVDRYYPVSTALIEIDPESGRAGSLDAIQAGGHAGMHVRGESSAGFPKKQYRLEMWNEWDDDRDIEPFGMPREADWIIHAPYSDKTLMRNYLSYKWFGDMGHYTVRTRFMELFFNFQAADTELTMADYRGVYLFMENIKRGGDRVDIARLEPWQNAEPEVTGGYMFRKDKAPRAGVVIPTVSTSGGESQTWQVIQPSAPSDQQITWLRNYLQSAVSTLHSAEFANPETGYARYFDVPSMIDEHILVELTKNIDGYRLSNYYFIDRGGKITGGPAWDYNLSLGNADYLNGWIPEGWYYQLVGGGDYPYYRRLFQDPEFALRYADRWYQLRRGIFSTASLMNDIDNTVALIDEAQERNFVKWPRLGVYDWPNAPGEPQRNTYEKQIAFMKDWLEDRVNWMDRQFERPVVFSSPGGVVEDGLVLTMSTGGLFDQRPGTIYYTLDGSDPRLLGGEVSSTAQALPAEGLVVDGPTYIRARLLRTNGAWSALNEALFVVGIPASSENFVVSEIMFHPAAPSDEETAAGFADQNDFEFIEFLNVSNSPVVLSGLRITQGVSFDFSQGAVQTIVPGGRVLVVRNSEAFAARYGHGLPVAGSYMQQDGSGRLDNGGETLALTSDFTGTVALFAYSDDEDAGWPAGTDGDGYSLVLRSEQAGGDFADPEAWTRSSAIGGSPGGPEGSSFPGSTLAGWKTSVFSASDLANAAISGDKADADGDGLTTLMEYVLQGNPLAADADELFGITRVEDQDGLAQIRFRRNTIAADYAVEVQTSTNVIEWTAANGLMDLVSSSPLNETSAEDIYQIEVSPEAGPERYFRLRVIPRN
ncbi:MAG TPA: CotH kinase family protein [Verrucomicrobiales bacterium]|nr:CotH kinase family protein [Verrucomicrobiales bacterium]